ncbi:roadblock/LC7 domain-containing protein [Streptomyces sp. NPDC047042]|uniref:roadblock/LC7 domain-containing protein n=1 Tax=Streptomyces sp. NPDC047042 TaxID=3154807 RepID=UPI00340A0057
MAAEAEVMDELRRLRARVPQLTGALAASVDGLVLVQDTPGVEPETVAALTATALSVAVRMAEATGQGDFRELLVRGVYGYVATYAAGRTAVLTLLAQDRVNVGRLHLEGRRAGLRIGELVDAEAGAETEQPRVRARPALAPPPTTTPTTTPTPTPTPPPMPTRTKTPRAPRTPTTTPNARTTTDS